MGKKGRRARARGAAPLSANPMVSVCTPTFNRRPFFEGLIKCYAAQTYDHARMEWIIVDDGTDSVEDLVKSVPGVRYFRLDKKMSLGEKRNFMHSKCKGEVVVYMDDDDYYPPSRVSHAVSTLRANPKALCAGSSEMYTYFPQRDETWVFGPYGEKHCTAATMAFRRELLTRTSYKNDAAIAEEKHFLKDYTIPFAQLDSIKSIVVIAHCHNTFDKTQLIKDGPNQFARQAHQPIADLIADEEMREFYTDCVHSLLVEYHAGLPSNKPDVEKQFQEIRAKRQAQAEAAMRESQRTGVLVEENGERRELTADEILDTLREQSQAIEALKARVEARDAQIASLRAQLSSTPAGVDANL